MTKETVSQEAALAAAKAALLIALDHGKLSGGQLAKKYAMDPFNGYGFVMGHVERALATIAKARS